MVTSAVRPRRLVHRGRVLARGLLVDPDLVGEATARARVLAGWRPGARVYLVEGAWLLLHDSAVSVDASAVGGVPVVEDHGVWMACPLSEAERAALAPSPGDLVWARGGVARRVGLSRALEQDPATWLDLSAFTWLAVDPLGGAAAVGGPRELPPPPDLRELLLGEAEGPPGERDEVLSSLLELAGAPSRPGSGAGPGPSPPEAAGGWVPGWLRRLLGRLSEDGALPGSGQAVQPAPPGLWERLAGRAQAAGERAILRSRAVEALGRRQAEYLRRMVGMFERGDLDEALRHAIGLRSGEGGRLSFGTPRPRSSLDFSLGAPGAGRSLLLFGGELHAFLTATYRNALARLKAQGRVREAVFVLVELLGEVDEAVRYLESVGELRLAAQLAEARGLPPGLAVRLWFLAGDVDRAIDVARATGSFFDAALRLERSHPESAATFRLRWADARAEAGDFLGAADVLRGQPRYLVETRRFLERAVVAGGVQAARALPALLASWPEAFDEVREQALGILESEAPPAAAARAGFARALPNEARSPALDALARPALRALLRDAEAGFAIAPADLVALTRRVTSGGLAVDVPALPAPRSVPLVARTEPLLHDVSPEDRGTLPILEAAFCESGSFLVALGEVGVQRLAWSGERRAHYDVPAEQLVLGDSGTFALAVHPRGVVRQVSRVDLVDDSAAPLFDLTWQAAASRTDGGRWFVADGDSVFGLDLVRRPGWTLWGVHGLKSEVRDVVATSEGMAFLTHDHELWTYQQPGLVLRARTPLPWLSEGGSGPAHVLAASCEPLHERAAAYLEHPTALFLRWSDRGQVRTEPLGEDEVPLGAPLLVDGLLVTTCAGRGEVTVRARRLDGTPVLVVVLRGAGRAAVRGDDRHLTIGDDQGRLILVDLVLGRVTRDLRLRG